MMAVPFILAVTLAITFSPFAHLPRVLVGVQPPLQLLDAALLAGCRVTFALLLAQRLKFLLQGVVTRPGLIIGIGHYGVLLVAEPGGPSVRSPVSARRRPGPRPP
jgi:hypothetical protein